MTKVVLRQKGSSKAGASSPLPPCDAHKGDVCAHHLPALTFMHPLYCRGSGPARSIRTEHSYKPCGEDGDKLSAKGRAGAPGGAEGREHRHVRLPLPRQRARAAAWLLLFFPTNKGREIAKAQGRLVVDRGHYSVSSSSRQHKDLISHPFSGQ